MLNTQRLLLLAWDNLGVGIIVLITTRDKHYYDEDDIKVSKQTNYKVSAGNVKKEASTEQPEIKKSASAPNKRKGMKKQIPSGQFLLFEDL